LTDVTIRESNSSAAELTITLENEDLYWIDNSVENGGADVFVEGAQIEVQMGYLNTDDAENDQLGPVRTFVIAGKPNISRDKITVKAITHAQVALGGRMVPLWYPPQKISVLVDDVLEKAGFDINHRVIQDTEFEVHDVVSHAGETQHAFLHRLALSMNYRFYVLPHPTDGKYVTHFHKPGWIPSTGGLTASPPSAGDVKTVGNLKGVGNDGVMTIVKPSIALGPAQELQEDAERTLALLAERLPSKVQVRPNPDQGFSKTGNGNIPVISTFFHYRPSPENENDFLDFSIRYETDGTPASMNAVGVDEEEGKVVDEFVSEKDKDEYALSPRNDYAAPDDQDKATAKNPLGQTIAASLFATTPDLLFNPAVTEPSATPPPRLTVQDLAVGRVRSPSGRVYYTLMAAHKPEQARAHAKAKLEGSQLPVALSITTMGRPRVYAGDLAKVEGLKMFDAIYIIEDHVQKYGSGGYTSEFSLKTDGVNDLTKPATPRKSVTLDDALLISRSRSAQGKVSIDVIAKSDGSVRVSFIGPTPLKEDQ
jgi:hypothetical protein